MNRTKMSTGRERGKKWNLGLFEREREEKKRKSLVWNVIVVCVYVGNFEGKRTKNGKTDRKKERNR